MNILEGMTPQEIRETIALGGLGLFVIVSLIIVFIVHAIMEYNEGKKKHQSDIDTEKFRLAVMLLSKMVYEMKTPSEKQDLMVSCDDQIKTIKTLEGNN